MPTARAKDGRRAERKWMMDVDNLRLRRVEPPIDGTDRNGGEAEMVAERRRDRAHTRDCEPLFAIDAFRAIGARSKDCHRVPASGQTVSEVADQDRRPADPWIVQVGDETDPHPCMPAASDRLRSRSMRRRSRT
jgi:hypothetical protein